MVSIPRSSSAAHNSQPTVPPGSPPRKQQIYQILAGKIFDSHARTLISNQIITVDKEHGVILDVRSDSANTYSDLPSNADVEVLDMRNLTIVPGFVDAHVHLFLYPYKETSWQDQLTKESLAERVARATVHARHTLLAGFTTVRDLGTEGAFDADMGLRKSMAGKNPIIPGPRYYCASRAIISTGAYGPKSSIYPSSEGIEGVQGAEVVDGIDRCVNAVRRQVGAGADWIKIYGDYRIRSRMSDVSQRISAADLQTFSDEELQAMVTTAHKLGVKVAVHAGSASAIEQAMRFQVDTIEHGQEMSHLTTNSPSHSRKHIWVPTLSAIYTIYGTSPSSHANWDRAKISFKKALEEGDDMIACGGDTGVFAHGKNAFELIIMRQLGAKWNQVLAWATLGGWKCVRGIEWEDVRGERRVQECEESPLGIFEGGGDLVLEREVPFGAIRKGWAADLVGIQGNLEGDPDAFEKAVSEGVKSVMKGGKLYKLDGKPVVEAFF